MDVLIEPEMQRQREVLVERAKRNAVEEASEQVKNKFRQRLENEKGKEITRNKGSCSFLVFVLNKMREMQNVYEVFLPFFVFFLESSFIEWRCVHDICFQVEKNFRFKLKNKKYMLLAPDLYITIREDKNWRRLFCFIILLFIVCSIFEYEVN